MKNKIKDLKKGDYFFFDNKMLHVLKPFAEHEDFRPAYLKAAADHKDDQRFYDQELEVYQLISRQTAINNLEAFMTSELKQDKRMPFFKRSEMCYKLAKKAIETGEIARPNYQQGSGRHSRLSDYESSVKFLLVKSGAFVVVGNDAERGGRHGVTIKAIVYDDKV